MDFNVRERERLRAVVDERARSDRCLLSASTGSTCAAASGWSVRSRQGTETHKQQSAPSFCLTSASRFPDSAARTIGRRPCIGFRLDARAMRRDGIRGLVIITSTSRQCAGCGMAAVAGLVPMEEGLCVCAGQCAWPVTGSCPSPLPPDCRTPDKHGQHCRASRVGCVPCDITITACLTYYFTITACLTYYITITACLTYYITTTACLTYYFTVTACLTYYFTITAGQSRI